jgi:2-dehydropantoate 2-reductase
LQQAGHDVHFLLRSDYAWVREHGLKVESVDGDFALPQVNAYANVAEMPPCDVVIVALKTTQNNLLPKLVLPVISHRGVVLVLQNGMGVEPTVADLVGSDRVLGGLCFICANKIGPGHIRHLDYKKIAIGEYRANYQPGGVTERMGAIAQDFEQAGIPVDLEADLFQTRWKKLVWNIPFNGLSVVLDATTDQMMADPHSRQLAEALMQEVVQAAATCGRPLPTDLIPTMIQHTDQMKPYRTSMKIDYDEHRPLEVEAIFGTPLRIAQAAGAHLPHIEMLYQLLKFLDAQNCREF